MGLCLTFPEGSAFVAGGTGNVGSGIVRALAEAGLPVTFTYRTQRDRAEEIEKSLVAEGWRVRALPMDLQDVVSIDAALDAAERFGGTVRTVACASGATVPFNRLVDFDIAEVEAFFDADAMAYYRLFHRVVPRLRSAGGGSITVTTTIATDRVIAWDGISPFSKGAVKMLVRQVAAEEGPHGIRCNDVGISWIVDLPIDEALAFHDALPSPIGERLGELTRQLKDSLRLRRSGVPADAGNLFAFLASDQASFITGQSIAIDGGMTL